MTPEEAVAERLMDITAVTDLVDERVFMLKMPQGENRPSIVVQMASDVRESHLRGGSRRGQCRVQVDTHVPEASGVDPYATASSIADAINGAHNGDALAGWQGSTAGSPSMDIEEVRFLQRLAPIFEAEEVRSVRIIQEYLVAYMTN